MNEDKAHEKSRKSKLPKGREIAFCESHQTLLGIPEITTTLTYERISTKQLEHRMNTKISMTKEGDLRRPDLRRRRLGDGQDTVPLVHRIRSSDDLDFPQHRQLSGDQLLLYRGKGASYDKITQFGLRPVEFMKVFRKVGQYFRWFVSSEKALTSQEIRNGLSHDVRTCQWIDCVGRRLWLRKNGFEEVNNYLTTLSRSGMHEDSIDLVDLVLDIVNGRVNETSHPDTFYRFVYTVSGVVSNERLPIPVYSSVTPNNPVTFLMHTVLMLGSFDTELEFKRQPSLKHCLMKAGVIGDDIENEDSLRQYVRDYLYRVVTEVFPVQPVTMRRLEDYIIKTWNLAEGVLLRDEIPVTELPPCLLTELLDSKEEEMTKFAEELKKQQVDACYDSLPPSLELPDKIHFYEANKGAFVSPAHFDPVATFVRSNEQSEESFNEQVKAVDIACRSIRKQAQVFGPLTATRTKSVITHGAPGSGKLLVMQYVCLYAISLGLRLVITALMGIRANVLG